MGSVANAIGEPLVVYRTRSSVQAALAEGLGKAEGLAALLKFLRRSMRVRSGPQMQYRWTRDKEPSAVLLDEVLERLDLSRMRSFSGRTSELERPERSRATKIVEDEQLYRALLLSGSGQLTQQPARFSYELRHEEGLDLSGPDEMWRDLVAGVPVETFAHRHFFGAPDASRTGSAAATQVLIAPNLADQYTLHLNSFKTRPGLVRFEALRSRSEALRQLNAMATVVAHRDPVQRPPHCLAIVTGMFGMGKSELIQEWLVRHAGSICQEVSDVLFVSNCSTKTEDEVCCVVRGYLEACQRVPLVVLDGLSLSGKTNELVWAESISTTGSIALVEEFARQIGKKPFVALLGVQLNSSKDSPLATLEVHPLNPQVRIAEVVQLEPMDDAESTAFLREITHSDAPLPTSVVEYLVNWSRGNPLLLCVAASGPSVLHDRTVADLSAWRAKDEKRASSTQVKLREGLDILNEKEGGQFAAMRFVSLFRRPLQIQVLKKILEDLEDLNIHVGRVSRKSLQVDVGAQPLFAMSPWGAVELHAHVKDMVARDLEVIVWKGDNQELKREIKAIHAVASRRALQLVAELFGLGEDRRKTRQWTQPDVETLFDLAHHLLGTRSPETAATTEASASSGSSGTAVPELSGLDLPKGVHAALKKAIQGTATNEEIERAVWREVMNPYRLTGSDLSSRGLFGLRLALLHRLVERWPDTKSMSEDTRHLRRGIRFELGACSMVAGDLLRARKELASVYGELRTVYSKSLAGWFFKSLVEKTTLSHLSTDDAVKLSVEYAKVVSTYSTVLFRMGRLGEALELLSEAKTGVADQLLAIAGKGKSGDEPLRKWQLNRLLQAARRIVTRWCEAMLFSTGYDEEARERLGNAFKTFLEVDMRGEKLNVRERERTEPADDLEDEGPGARLVGESARAFVRLAVRMANQFCAAATYIPLAQELVENVREAAAHEQRKSQWSNDTIGCLLDEVMLARQADRFSEAQANLSLIDAEPRYKNLGRCSMAVKYEVKMAHAKLALAMNGMVGLTENEIHELQGVAASAAATGHVAASIDAHLLLAINAQGSARLDHMRPARELFELCSQYRLRNDTFQALEFDRPITQELSIFG